MKIIFLDQDWEDYLYWQSTDKSVLKKINSLIKEIERMPFDGNGKPEPLRHNLAGWWSRRVDLGHRLVNKVNNDAIERSNDQVSLHVMLSDKIRGFYHLT